MQQFLLQARETWIVVASSWQEAVLDVVRYLVLLVPLMCDQCRSLCSTSARLDNVLNLRSISICNKLCIRLFE